MSDFITVLRDTCPVPVLDATKWKRIDGDPHTVNLNAYASADGSKLMGTWICTPGSHGPSSWALSIACRNSASICPSLSFTPSRLAQL